MRKPVAICGGPLQQHGLYFVSNRRGREQHPGEGPAYGGVGAAVGARTEVALIGRRDNLGARAERAIRDPPSFLDAGYRHRVLIELAPARQVRLLAVDEDRGVEMPGPFADRGRGGTREEVARTGDILPAPEARGRMPPPLGDLPYLFGRHQ